MLVKKLDDITIALDKKQYKLAFVKLKVFLEIVKSFIEEDDRQKDDKLTKEQGEKILKSVIGICLAIKADAQGIDKSWTDEKVNEYVGELEKFYSDKSIGKVYDQIMDIIAKLADRIN